MLEFKILKYKIVHLKIINLKCRYSRNIKVNLIFEGFRLFSGDVKTN